MNNILFNDENYINTEDYKNFNLYNNSTGLVKIQVHSAFQAIPLENVKIVITKIINANRIEFFRGTTDKSGIIDNIELPCKKKTTEHDIINCTYNIVALDTKYKTVQNYEIKVYDSIKVIQHIKMIPNGISKE